MNYGLEVLTSKLEHASNMKRQIISWKRSLWSPKSNLPFGCSARIPDRSHGWFAELFSLIIYFISFKNCSSAMHATSRYASLLTRYDKRQDLECQKSFHPFLSNFGLNWTSEITEFWCRINSSHQPASGNSIFYLTYTFKSAQSITNDFLTCQTKLFS